MAKHIVKLFTIMYRYTILVFPYQTLWQHSDGDPLTGASNARGYEKISIFKQYLSVSQKRYEIDIVSMEY